MFDLLCWWVWVLIMVLMAVNPLNSVFGFWWLMAGGLVLVVIFGVPVAAGCLIIVACWLLVIWYL